MKVKIKLNDAVILIAARIAACRLSSPMLFRVLLRATLRDTAAKLTTLTTVSSLRDLDFFQPPFGAATCARSLRMCFTCAQVRRFGVKSGTGMLA